MSHDTEQLQGIRERLHDIELSHRNHRDALKYHSVQLAEVETEIRQLKRADATASRRIASIVATAAGALAGYLFSTGHPVWAITAFIAILWSDYNVTP
jgi:chromosome segregation ATPase